MRRGKAKSSALQSTQLAVGHACMGRVKARGRTCGCEVHKAWRIGEDSATAGYGEGVLKAGHQFLKLLHEVGGVGQLGGVWLVLWGERVGDLHGATSMSARAVE